MPIKQQMLADLDHGEVFEPDGATSEDGNEQPIAIPRCPLHPRHTDFVTGVHQTDSKREKVGGGDHSGKLVAYRRRSEFKVVVGLSEFVPCSIGLNHLQHSQQDRKSTRLNSSHVSI